MKTLNRYAVPGSQGDEREHVQVAVYDGRPSALEEGPTSPQHNGGGESELNPGAGMSR